MKDKPNNRGEVMLESLVVYTITIFLLFFILAIFSALYQRWNVQTISNETAARYAQTYRFSDKDILSGYVTKDQLVAVKEYRYLGNSLEDSSKKEVLDYSKTGYLEVLCITMYKVSGFSTLYKNSYTL